MPLKKETKPNQTKTKQKQNQTKPKQNQNQTKPNQTKTNNYFFILEISKHCHWVLDFINV